MKEQSTGGHHGNVATGTSSIRSDHGRTAHSATDNNNSSKCFGGPCLDSEEEEEDWEEDLGIGKLVIDLDADADKTRSPPSSSVKSSAHNTHCGTVVMNASSPQKPANKPAVNATNAASPQKLSANTKHGTETSVAHSAEKGLKMKIKRSGSGKSTASLAGTASMVSSVAGSGTNSTKQDNRQDAKPGDNRLSFSGGDGSSNHATLQSTVERIKHSLSERERSNATSSGKSRSNSKKDRSSKSSKVGGNNDVMHPLGVATFTVSAPTSTQPVSVATTSSCSFGTSSSTVTSNVTVDLDRISMTPFGNGTSIKRENPSHDPYEFNAKVEDRIGIPMKKMKVEKSEASTSSTSAMTPSPSERHDPPMTGVSQSTESHPGVLEGTEHRDMAVGTSDVGVITDPDCLGPCEPGTSVVLEGIVWNETNSGLLVVNVTWRGKTYVGTLMDATRHDWAPPRLNCDSPSNELDPRTPKGRGKRGRSSAPTPRPVDNGSDRKLRSNRRNNNGNPFACIPSPARLESLGAKRKARSEPDPAMFDPPKPNKRTRTDSRLSDNGGTGSTSASSDGLIECPEMNCSKKYRHINGLRYHQSHAHKHSNGSSSSGASVESDSAHSEDKSIPTEPSTPTAISNIEPSTSKQKEEDGFKKKVESKCNNDVKHPNVPALIKVKEEPVEKLVEKSVEKSLEKSIDMIVEKSNEKVEKIKNDKEEKKAMDKPGTSACSSNSQKTSKHPTVSLTPVTVTKTAITTGSMVYQISGTQIGLVTSNGSVVTQATNQIMVSTLGASSVPVSIKPVTVTALTTLPVAVTTATAMRPIAAAPSPAVTAPTAPSSVTQSPAKHEGERKKKDKSEKHRHKSSGTRPIMPAPPTTHIAVSHTPASTQAQVSTASVSTSQLKPIQPKPTVLGTTPVNPALVSLKEMKEKKPKKKKNKDKDRERHRDGEKSHHEHKSKVSLPSVIKTTPIAVESQQKIVVNRPAGDAQQKVTQRPVDIQPKTITVVPASETKAKLAQVSGADTQQKEASTPPQLEKQQPVNLVKDRVAGAQPVRILQTLAPVAAKQGDGSNPARGNSDQDAHSPAYSDISDANESAPTLEKETQPLQSEPQQSEQPPSVQTQDYSSYYGQPPFLTPAVPPSSQDQKDAQTAAALQKSASKPETKNGAKTGPSNTPSPAEEEKKDGGSRPSSTTATHNLSGQEPKQSSTPEKNSQPGQQKAVYGQTQYPYMGQYYGVDPNYVQMMATNPEYRERMMEEHRRRHEQMQQHQQQQQQQPPRQAQGGNPQHQQSQQQQHSQVHPQSQPHPQHQMHTQSHPQSQKHPAPQLQPHFRAQPHPQPQSQAHSQMQKPSQPQLQSQSQLQHSKATVGQSGPSTSQASGSQHQGPAVNGKATTPQSQHSPSQKPQNQQQQQHAHTPQTAPSHQHQPSPQSQQHSPQVKHKQQQQQQQPRTQPQQKTHPQQPSQHSKQPSQNPGTRPNHGSSQSGHHSQADHGKTHSTSKSRPSSTDTRDQNRKPKEESKPTEERSSSVPKPPPSLISDREREDLKQRERDRADQNLREKQNENRQILKENIELKEQMDNHKFEPYDNKSLVEKQREELQRYYMFHQQRYLEHQRYTDGKGGPEHGGNPMVSPRENSEQSAPDGLASQKHELDHHFKEQQKLKEEDRPRSVDHSSAASSPRTTPKLKEQGPMGHHPVMAAGPVSVSYAQYYSSFIQPQHAYGGQIPFDPNHAGMYPGVNPVIGYSGPAYIHPSQIRYHVPNNGEPMPGEKVMMMSPGVVRPEGGKALDLLQQHASQYYNAGNGPHKIHELQDVAKCGDKARATNSPATKDSERPDSRNSVGPDGKLRESRTSPPTQRHLHTHHHTHVLGAPQYPQIPYGQYGAPIMTSPSGPAAAQPSIATQHSLVQK